MTSISMESMSRHQKLSLCQKYVVENTLWSKKVSYDFK